jgi:signal transduction histidine kinase
MLNNSTLALLDRMAHDLRAPLHAILALCELLEADVYGPLAQAQRGPVADLAAEGQRMQDLLEEALDLVRLQAGRYRPEPVTFDPAVTLRRVTDRWGAELVAPPGAAARQDEAKLERLVDRLVCHARRRGAPRVELVSAPPLLVRVTPVVDVSFDPLDLPQPLGPAVARGLARLCGGDVYVDGGGFVIDLPEL